MSTTASLFRSLSRSSLAAVFSLLLLVALAAALFPAPAASALTPDSAPTDNLTLTTGDGLALTLSADGRVQALALDGDAQPIIPAAALWLRDMSAAGAVTEPNLIANPGFETGLDAWTEVFNQGLDVGVVVSPTHSGDSALAFTNTLAAPRLAALANDPVAVTPGQRYRVAAWFRSSIGYVTQPTGAPPFMQREIWQRNARANGVYVLWLDAQGRALGDPQLAAPLHANATRWRLLRGEMTAPPDATQARVIIAAKLEKQTLWVDDAALVASPEVEEPLAGTVTPCEGQDNCLSQEILLDNDLRIAVTYTARANHIAVHGELTDLTGGDRALDVSWGLPLAAAGWTWRDDAHTARTITTDALFANEISAIYDGWQPISLYPYAGLDDGDVGLALGLPLDRPQLALLAYDGQSGRYAATYHLGVSPLAARVGPRATFDLQLYRFDPTWGFRDVIARHHELQSAFYTTPRADALYDYDGRSQGPYYTRRGALAARQEDADNIYSAQYTSSDLVLQVNSSAEEQPTMAEIMEALTATLNSPNPDHAALGRAITASAAVDPNGDWSLKHVGVFPWGPDHWEAAWAGNVDPDLEQGLASFLLERRVSRAFSVTTEAGAHLDGVQIDNFMSNPTFDLRPDALAASHWPLGYTPHTYQPAVHTGYAQEEYLAYLRHDLDETWGAERCITINFWGMGHPNYLARYIDGFGSEGNLGPDGRGRNWTPSILDYRRAIAYQRPYLFTNQTVGLTAEMAYTSSQLSLLYGVWPGHGPNGANWEPAAEQIISDTAELVGRYWAAGWEPIPYASADDEHVWIERFGGGETETAIATLFFAIYNHSDAQRTAVITLETQPLHILHPELVHITDIATTETIPYGASHDAIRFRLSLLPGQTRVLRIDHPIALAYLPLILHDAAAGT